MMLPRLRRALAAFRRIYAAGLIALALVAASGTARASTPPIRFPAQEVADSFRVGLDWFTPTVVVGEPLRFRLHFTYFRPGRENKFQVSWDLAHDVAVLITYPSHGEIRLRGVSDLLIPLAGVYQMHPGETQYLEKSVLFLPDAFSGLVFERPGTYTVRVLVRCGIPDEEQKTLVFGPFAIRVEAPEGDDRKAVEFLDGLDIELSREVVRRLQAMRATAKTREAMEGLLAAAPHGRLAPYALIALATVAAHENQNDRVLDLARTMYSRFPSHMLTDSILFLASEAYIKKGEEETGLETYRRMFLLFPESPLFRSHDMRYLERIVPTLRPADPLAWMLFPPGAAPTREEWIAMKSASPPVPADVSGDDSTGRSEYVTLPDFTSPID